jgi:hemolysin activation/secretion protein
VEINSINTTTALASFFIAFAIMLIGVLVAIPPAGTVIIIQEAQAQQQEQQTREEALTEATENMPDGPSETLAADDPTQKEGDEVAPNADKELDTVTVCIDVPPSQMTEEVTVGEAQFLEETIPESELSYGAC